jgi:hypothetical protein
MTRTKSAFLGVAAVAFGLFASVARANGEPSEPCSLQWKSYSAAQPNTPERAEWEHAWKACIATSRETWAASLNPLPNGGWTFLMVTDDGTFAIFGSHRHATREGNIATLWLRYENRESQSESGQYYMSKVEREMYDCARMASKPVSITYYGGNNLDAIGNSFTYDESKVSWAPVIPGTIGDSLLDWACKSTPRAQRAKAQ